MARVEADGAQPAQSTPPAGKRRVLRVLAWVLAALLLAVGAFVAMSWAPDVAVDELKPRWAQAPSTFIEIEGMQVHLRDEGPRTDAQPIVLIHGTSSSLHTWDGWADALKGQRRVIRFDLPGFGLTGPHPQARYDTASYVRFVVAVLDRLGVAECVLAGNSLGGEVAWRTAAAAPQRVARLVLVDAAGYPLVPRSIPLGFRIAATPALHGLMRNLLPRPVIAASVRDVYGNPDRVSDELIDRYMDMTRRAGNRQALAQRLMAMRLGEEIHRIRSLTQPTLIIWGARDRLIPPEHAARFKRDLIGSTLRVFNDLGHVPQEEDPAATVGAVKAFLKL